MAKIIVRNDRCQILSLNNPEVRDELDLKLSYMIQGFQFMGINNNWDGRHGFPSARNIIF